MTDEPVDVRAVVTEHLERGDARGWFEPVYRAAGDNPRAVPWARLAPHPHLVSWLEQPGLEVRGCDALVVGCGLGDDAAELAERGARVVAFDVAPTAVAAARRRFPDHDVDWRVADLFEAPPAWRGGFGLVVEVRTAQSFPEELRDVVMRAVAGFVGPGGYLLHVGLMATSAEAAEDWSGPPWALAPSELAAYRAVGLEELALEHPPDPGRQVMEIRLLMRRPGDGHGSTPGSAVPD